MSLRKTMALGLALVAGLAASGTALADRGGGRGWHGAPHGSWQGHGHGHGHGHWHGGRARIGVFIGAPLVWSGFYARPYHWGYPYDYYPYPYWYPPGVAAPAWPQSYVERGDSGADSTPAPAYWYYCAAPKGYYPYVKKCPGGWQRVPAEPPANVSTAEDEPSESEE